MAEGPLSPQERAALRARVAGLAHRPALAVVCLGELPAWVRQDCAVCGENTAESFLHVHDGKLLCRDCYKAYSRFDV